MKKREGASWITPNITFKKVNEEKQGREGRAVSSWASTYSSLILSATFEAREYYLLQVEAEHGHRRGVRG